MSALRDAIEKLLGANYTHGHVDIMGLLVEPVEHPWQIGWHRDGVVEVPPEARDEIVKAKLAEVWYDLRHFNQVNCAIYADSCTWFVPGSHLRQWDMPGEEQSTGDPRLRKPVEGESNAEGGTILFRTLSAVSWSRSGASGAGRFYGLPESGVAYRKLHNLSTAWRPFTMLFGTRGKKDWTDWQQTKLDAVQRMKENR